MTTVGKRETGALGTATVREAMTRGVIHCSAETPLRNVARLMADHGVHGVYVFDYGVEDDETVELWGLVSDLDVVSAAETDLDGATAREWAVSPALTVRTDDLLADAARCMAETGVSHLAVIDPATGRPAGVLSTLDVVRLVARWG